MEVNISQQQGLDAVLSVKVSETDYKSDFEKALKDYGRKMNVPGFRPGHVPTGLIKKMIGKDAKREIVEKFLQKNIEEYLNTNNIKLILSPLSTYHAEDIDWMQNELAFSYDIGFRPEMNPDVQGLSSQLTRYRVELTDEDVKKDVENLRKQSGRPTPTTAYEKNNDNFVSIRFTELNEEGEALEGGLEKMVRYNDSNMPAKVADMVDGKMVNDEWTVKIADIFTADEMAAAFDIDIQAAKDLFPDFKMAVVSVLKIEQPELNEEFFKRYFPEGNVTTEEEFYTEWRKIMDGYFNNQANNMLAREAKKALVAAMNVALPENFIKKYFLLSYEAQEEADVEDYDKKYEGFNNELKWVMLSEYFSEQNKIEVSEDEIIQYTEDMLRDELVRSGYYDVEASKLRQYAIDYLTKENNFNRTAMALRDGKVFDWLLTQISPKVEGVSMKNFEELKNNQ